MPTRYKVVITDFDYGDVHIEEQILEPAGARVVALQARSEADLAGETFDCDAVMTQYRYVGAETIARMTQCKVIARYGVGVDIVDVPAATEKGILVTNVRNYCTEEVADHAISLWLALARKLLIYNEATHRGVWRWQTGAPIRRLRDQVLGIVSFGQIGRAIAVRAQAFGLRVIAYDPYVDDQALADHRVQRATREEVIQQSDVLMMQVPNTPDTYHFIGESELRQMKKQAVLVNTGRGPTVDNQALYRALTEGWIAGAGLDDPEEEPAKKANWSPANNPLFTLPNVIVTPHAAYYSEESIQQARTIAATEVARVLSGLPPHYPVNQQPLQQRHATRHA